MSEMELFRAQLADLGVQKGDVVLVHSSMKALGTRRTPEEVIADLQAAVGEEGTLLFPALTYDNVTAEQPVFSSEETEPCIGLLPRVFMRLPGVMRSENPTHSVCAHGRLAKELTSLHEKDDTAVGPHSPFMLLPLYAGKLLFLGDVLDACTFMHGVEDIVRAPYLRDVPERYVVNGKERIYCRRDNYGWGSEFGRIADILSEPDLRKGKVGAANAYLVDTRALLAAAISRMREDPYAFVTDISRWL